MILVDLASASVKRRNFFTSIIYKNTKLEYPYLVVLLGYVLIRFEVAEFNFRWSLRSQKKTGIDLSSKLVVGGGFESLTVVY